MEAWKQLFQQKKNNQLFCKSKIIQKVEPVLCFGGIWSSSGEQVGGRCLQHGRGTGTHQSGCRMQDARRTQGPAAASYPKHNFTASPQCLPPPPRRAAALLAAREELRVPDRRRKLLLGPGHGNVYVSRRSPLPSLAPSSLPSHARPAARAAFVLLQG